MTGREGDSSGGKEVAAGRAPLRVGAGAALLAAAAFAVYYPALRGTFISDDYLLLADNRLVAAANGLWRFWFSTEPIDYWPVSSSMFWVEWRLWGRDPAGYHVVNVAVHAGTAWLAWAVWNRLRIPGAFLAALLFVVHPVNVETVAWIAQRKTLMALLFGLASVFCYLQSEAAAGGRDGARSERGWYAASILLFVVAMLSKGTVGIVPIALLLAVAWERAPRRRDLARVLPFFLVTAALTPVNAWFQARLEANQVQVAGWAEHLLGVGGVGWFYLAKAFVPVRLTFHYPEWRVEVLAWRSWILPAATVAATGLLWRYRRRGTRGPLFAWAYFWIALLPVLAAPRTWGLVADRYQHAGLLGVTALAGAAWARARRLGGFGGRWLADAVALIVAGTLAFLAHRQAALYEDPMKLYQATLAVNPSSWTAHGNLGYAYMDADQLQQAADHFEAALRLNPEYADAHNNLGLVLFRRGDVAGAIAHYEKALSVRPWFPNAQANLGNALARQRRLEEAVVHFAAALRMEPDHALARNNLGAVLLDLGRAGQAVEELELAVRSQPNFAEAHDNLARALFHVGRRREAIEHYRRSLQLSPAQPKVLGNLGVALAEDGQLQEAVAQFERALELDPDDRIARDNLDEVRMMQQRAAGEKGGVAQPAHGDAQGSDQRTVDGEGAPSKSGANSP